MLHLCYPCTFLSLHPWQLPRKNSICSSNHHLVLLLCSTAALIPPVHSVKNNDSLLLPSISIRNFHTRAWSTSCSTKSAPRASSSGVNLTRTNLLIIHSSPQVLNNPQTRIVPVSASWLLSKSKPPPNNSPDLLPVVGCDIGSNPNNPIEIRPTNYDLIESLQNIFWKYKPQAPPTPWTVQA